MSEEEFFKRLLNKITKEFGYDVASTLELMFMTKEKKVEQLEKELNQEKEEYAGLHKVLNNKEEEFEKENYNNVVEISRLKRKVEQLEKEIDRLNNIIDEFEDWLGKQRIRNCEWDNFVIKDTRLGIPITYLLNKLKELKDSD